MPDHDLLTELEIQALLRRERYYRDSSQWENLRQSYDPDAAQTSIKVSWFSGNVDGFVEGSKHMAAAGSQSAHTFSPIEVQFNKSRTKGVAVSTGSVIIRLTHEGIEYDIVSCVRFVSKVRKLENVGWRMLSLEAIYERDSLTPTRPIADSSRLPVIDTAKFRASYKYLTWNMTLRGYDVPQDLPGTDDEKSVKTLLDAVYSWLHDGT